MEPQEEGTMNATQVNAKPWYLSRTYWVNAIAFIAFIGGFVLDNSHMVEIPKGALAWLGLIVAVLNFWLRSQTVQPIAPSKGIVTLVSKSGGATMKRLAVLAVVFGAVWLLTPGTRIAAAQTPSTPQTTAHWHEPTTHEHGDAEPQWLVDMFLTYPQLQPLFGADSTGHLAYDVPFNTSPAENSPTGKHFAMKGFHLSYSADKATGFHGRDGSWLDGYARVHISSTPVDRGARFHSAAIFIAGNGKLLAIRQGWIDTGNVDTARVPEYCALTGSTDAALRAACDPYDAFQRPIVFTVTQDSLTGKYTGGKPRYQEQWYPVGDGFSWGWGISDAVSVEQMGEKATDYDMAKWGVVRGANGQQSVGLLRQLDLTARAIPLHDTFFYTTQFGDYVADPKSAECQTPNICLLQYYNDFPGIEGRSVVTDFPGRGKVTIPN